MEAETNKNMVKEADEVKSTEEKKQEKKVPLPKPIMLDRKSVV